MSSVSLPSRTSVCQPHLGLPQQLAAGTRSPDGVANQRRSSVFRFRSNRARAPERSHRSSSTRPASRPRGVSRRSALSIRSRSRCSARDVNIRYGSRHPLVIRSSTRMPMYASSRRSSNGRLAARSQCRVDAGDDSLRRRLFVAGRAVDLAREKQSRDALRLERARQLRRLDEVVLDRVAGTQQHRVLEPRQRVNELGLHVARQAHRKPVDVDLARRRALRARERSGAAPCPGTARSCPRATGSSAGRCRESAR